MDIQAINELITKRQNLQVKLEEINNQLTELNDHYNQFYNNIEKNSNLMTTIEKIEKITTFSKVYNTEKRQLENKKNTLIKDINLNGEEIASKSRIPAQEYALIVKQVLEKNGINFTESYTPFLTEKMMESSNSFDISELPLALNLVKNPNKIISTDDVNNNKITIATLLSCYPDYSLRQTKLARMEVPVIEADHEREKLLIDAKTKIPTFNLNIDGGAGYAYATEFGNWLADAVRNELGIIPASKKVETPTM